MIIPHAAENRKIRGICPCPAIREGDTRVGVLRVSGRTSRVYARPAAGFPCCLFFPNISIIALSAPKEKGFPSLLLCFASEGGKMLFSVKADAFGSAAKQFKQHGGSFPVTIKTKPHGSAMRRGRGGDRRRSSVYIAPSSLPQERNPLRNKKVQLVLTPKSNEIKRNQMKSNFLDEHPFPVLQYHCRNSGE